MAPNGERPSRGRRRMAARRAGPSPARRTTPAEAPRPDPGWEEPFARSDTAEDDFVADAAPPVPPDDAEPTDDPVDEPPVVVVATTPGAPAPKVTPHLAPAPRVAARRAPAAPAAAPAATDPAPTHPAVAPASGAGEPDPSSELGRMFSRLLVRMGNVERRLDGFEGRLQAAAGSDGGVAPAPDTDREAQDADREYDRQMLTWLADRVEALTADMEEQRQQGEGSSHAVEDAVNRTEILALGVAELQARLDDLAATREDRDRPVACPEHQVLAPAVADLQREAAAATERALALEARMAQFESLPSMEEVANHQFQLLAAELPSAPVDIEAVYKELDSVAEVLAARDAAVTRGLERVESLEATVSGLREHVVGLMDALAASRAGEGAAQERIRTLEQRLEALESPEHDVQRLYSALDRARGAAPGPGPPGGVETTSIRVAGGGRSPGPDAASSGDAGSEPPQRAIQSLAADLDRIRRSLEVLADEATRAD